MHSLLMLLLAVNVYASGITVMVIDTGIDPVHDAFSGTDIACKDIKDCEDKDGHGTGMASLVINGEMNEAHQPTAKVCKNVTIISCAYGKMGSDKKYHVDWDIYLDCLKDAYDRNVFLVNYSSAGPDFNKDEYLAIKLLATKDIKFVAATGNEGTDMREKPFYPSMFSQIEYIPALFTQGYRSLRNVYPVAGLTRSDQRYNRSNYAPRQYFALATSVRSAYNKGTYATFTGTSVSAALFSNQLIRTRCEELGYEQ